MRFELWDIGARFMIGRFASEADALDRVRAVLTVEGDAFADQLELVIGEDGERNLSGRDLVERARAVDRSDHDPDRAGRANAALAATGTS